MSPYSIESRQAAIEPESAGMAKGLTKRGPRSSVVTCPSMTCSSPPPPVLTIDADTIALLRRPVAEVEAGVGHGLLAGGHGEVDEAAHAPRHLAVHAGGGIEVLDLGCDAHVEIGGVEVGDGSATAHARLGVGPEGGVVVADGRDRADDR